MFSATSKVGFLFIAIAIALVDGFAPAAQPKAASSSTELGAFFFQKPTEKSPTLSLEKDEKNPFAKLLKKPSQATKKDEAPAAKKNPFTFTKKTTPSKKVNGAAKKAAPAPKKTLFSFNKRTTDKKVAKPKKPFLNKATVSKKIAPKITVVKNTTKKSAPTFSSKKVVSAPITKSAVAELKKRNNSKPVKTKTSTTTKFASVQPKKKVLKNKLTIITKASP